MTYTDYTTAPRELATPDILDDIPFDTEVDLDTAHQDWLNDAAAQSEYQAWSESQHDPERYDADMTALYEADMEAEHLERQAEEWELRQLGEGYLHCIAGHDLTWQQGGN